MTDRKSANPSVCQHSVAKRHGGACGEHRRQDSNGIGMRFDYRGSAHAGSLLASLTHGQATGRLFGLHWPLPRPQRKFDLPWQAIGPIRPRPSAG